MLTLIFLLANVLGLLMVSEYLWRKKILKGEPARKFVHILVGTFVAFWPYFISFEAIRLISLAFLLVVLVSQKFKIFHAVHGVGRKTWGDSLFAIGIGLSATLTTSPWIFTAAILHLSLADGLAGLVGSKWGKNTSYEISGETKSLVGSGTFYIISFFIVGAVIALQPALQSSALPLLLMLPILVTLVENIGIYGSDNVFIPLIVVVALTGWS